LSPLMIGHVRLERLVMKSYVGLVLEFIGGMCDYMSLYIARRHL
jgi:hypothetical protein